MKPTQNTVVHVLLGVVVLFAVWPLYLLLVPHGRPGLSPLASIAFVTAALVLIAAAFGPSILLRSRSAPPPMSRSEIGLFALVAVAGCALAVFGVFSGMWWIMTLGIMLGPLVFMFRGARPR